MITYVDTSSLLKLIVEEEGSDQAASIWASADILTSIVLVEVEARAALAAARRGQRLDEQGLTKSKAELNLLLANLHMVDVTDGLISESCILAEEEGLRGYDAVHLAAAITVQATVFTSSDAVLCAAAERRGVYVANPIWRG
ncbi:MAG: type II toxin-antitoxin system VapC family toxin [Actinobacteria bacterium]|nr:type II toxin-antitoxin system VapC family toxin [Actinomycetota bacterium]MCB9390266.1 type II toxin-antitoxin system VapC family toxin [Acidimicrobiia bacterium]